MVSEGDDFPTPRNKSDGMLFSTMLDAAPFPSLLSHCPAA